MIEHLKYVIYVGILVSFYSIYVEFKLGKKKYKPLCDISKKFSCSVAFKGKYGRVFGLPNSLLGFGFYFVCLLLLNYSNFLYIFYLSLLGILMTLYLVYVSYFKMKNYCAVCHVSYIVNLFMLLLSYKLAF